MEAIVVLSRTATPNIRNHGLRWMEVTYIYRTQECHSYVHQTSLNDLYCARRSDLDVLQGARIYDGYTLREVQVVVPPKRVSCPIDPNVAYPTDNLQSLCETRKFRERKGYGRANSRNRASRLLTRMPSSAKH